MYVLFFYKLFLGFFTVIYWLQVWLYQQFCFSNLSNKRSLYSPASSSTHFHELHQLLHLLLIMSFANRQVRWKAISCMFYSSTSFSSFFSLLLTASGFDYTSSFAFLFLVTSNYHNHQLFHLLPSIIFTSPFIYFFPLALLTGEQDGEQSHISFILPQAFLGSFHYHSLTPGLIIYY